MRKFRKVYLGLGITFTAVLLLMLVGINFIVPFLNPIAMAGAPLFTLLFAVLGIRRRQGIAKRILLILLALLCVAAIVYMTAMGGLYWLLSAQANFGRVYPSPLGLHKMVVVDTGLFHYEKVYPLYLSCYYLAWQGRGSDGYDITQFRWENNHIAEVFLANTVTFDRWWSYNFWTRRWEIDEKT